MNENVDKNLDQLSRKIMRQSSIEQPPFDFTQNVMAQIESLEHSKVTTYTPLISKRIWVFIALLFIVIFGLAVFGATEENTGWINYLRLDIFSQFSIQNPLSNFKFSQTMFYALLLFAVMLCVQIPILKHYFDKRLEL